MNIDMFEKLVIFSLGGLVGALVAIKMLQHSYDEELQEEIDSLKGYYHKKELKNKENGVESMNVNNTMVNYSDMVDELYVHPSETEHPKDDGPEEDDCEPLDRRDFKTMSNVLNIAKRDSPYVIPLESFSDEMPTHDKITLTYYEEDNTLADEDESIIPDIDTVVGQDSLLAFGEGSEDPDVVYVRNERFGSDYEIVRTNKSYQESVLGLHPADAQYSNPHKTKRGRLDE